MEIFKENPELLKITRDVLIKTSKNLNINLDFNKSIKENFNDDLDIVEFIMILEKDLDIIIKDTQYYDFVKLKPGDFEIIRRQGKLNKLGI